MPILKADDKLALFIHVPRTGGTTVEYHLSKAGVIFFKNFGRADLLRVTAQHLHGSELKALFPDRLFDYAFMIVRHPVQRIVSEYGFHDRANRARLPFSLWLRHWMMRRRIKPHCRDNHLRAQVEFECFNAEVFRLEDGLEPLFARLEETMGVPQPAKIEFLNASRAARGAPAQIARRDVDLIYREYRGDFDRYGYDPAKF